MQTTGVAIPGQYIVVMKNDSASASSVDAIASEHPGEVQHRYSAALNGLSLSLNDAGLGKMLADPRVAYVEEDEAVTLSTVQTGAAWGLDRIDQKKLPLSTTYSYAMDGSGVTVYIIDTGINFFHTEYAGRAFTGVDEITPGGTAIDCLGHGTSVAGVVGGTTYGVAKKVKMVSVRVYDCKGAGAKSQLIAGVDWVTAHRVRPAVANMSLISSPSAALNQAVLNSMAAGVTYVVAAGNGTQDACISSPAQVAGVIAVGATTNTDGFANFSNFGKCVSINAPGANIPTSALASSNSATTVASGTSLSSPSVAGAAALYLQQNPGASPAQVLAALKSNATANVITNLSAGTPNLLLYTGFIVGVTTPPVANYTSSCPALACSFDASTSTALASATYAWTFGDGATATGKTSSHTYAAAGAYSVVLTVTDANGTGTKTTTVNPGATSGLPVARFTIACPGMQCAVDASTSSSNGGIVRYAWAWGDGRTEAHPFATTKSTWATTGTYAVTLTVTDAAGRTNSVTKQVP
ncbi:MAG: S8 family serine peptidase, partial [bacterium]